MENAKPFIHEKVFEMVHTSNISCVGKGLNANAAHRNSSIKLSEVNKTKRQMSDLKDCEQEENKGQTETPVLPKPALRRAVSTPRFTNRCVIEGRKFSHRNIVDNAKGTPTSHTCRHRLSRNNLNLVTDSVADFGSDGHTQPQSRTPVRSISAEETEFLTTPDYFNKVSLETPKRKSFSNNYSCLHEEETSNLTVGVRVRPLNYREKNDPSVIEAVKVNGKEIIITGDNGVMHKYLYDHIFLSNNLQEDTQDDVFNIMVMPLIDKVFEGYNACLFAYGQTGSGKSYSMMGLDIDSDCGYGEKAGIIPRFCHEVFGRISSSLDDTNCTTVEISYFEIYNEKIHDLLGGSFDGRKKAPLKVREHPVFGPYVVDLSLHGVKSYEDLKGWITVGNSQRATSATGINEKSSRSHSIFSVILTQRKSDTNKTDSYEYCRHTKINLVDLAGSERLSHTCATGDRLREGVSINRSLLTLGKVISSLADNAHNKKKSFVPYRDSVLTWLLRESLGGNSRTSMLATISPANIHAEETLATLRYACQARTIINTVHVNEAPHDRLIRELRQEIDRLRSLREEYDRQKEASKKNQTDNTELGEEVSYEINKKEQEILKLQEKLRISEEHFYNSERSWSERLEEAEKCKSAELDYLRQLGVAFQLDIQQQACLINLTPDPMLSGTLLYLLPIGRVHIGRHNSKKGQFSDISLTGPLIQDQHCSIINEDGKLTLVPGINSKTFVNGKEVERDTILHHGDRLVVGGNHYFRISNPTCPVQDTSFVDQPVDYNFAHLEIQKVQEERLRKELENAKLAALMELEETKVQTEKQLGDQRLTYEQQLKDLDSALAVHKMALAEVKKERDDLKVEKTELEAKISNRTVDNVEMLSPFKSHLLEEVKKALCDSPEILEYPKDGSAEKYLSQSLHDIQLLVREASERCRELSINFKFYHQQVMQGSKLETAIKVHNPENNRTSLWTPEFFHNWLEQLREYYPGDNTIDLTDANILWEEDDTETFAKDKGCISINVQKLRRQLNESFGNSFLDQSFQSNCSSLINSVTENCSEKKEALKYLSLIENASKNLRVIYDDEKVCSLLDRIDDIVSQLTFSTRVLGLNRSNIQDVSVPSFSLSMDCTSNFSNREISTETNLSCQENDLDIVRRSKPSKSVRFCLTTSQQQALDCSDLEQHI